MESSSSKETKLDVLVRGQDIVIGGKEGLKAPEALEVLKAARDSITQMILQLEGGPAKVGMQGQDIVIRKEP